MFAESMDSLPVVASRPRCQPLVVLVSALACGILADRYWTLALAWLIGLASVSLLVWLGTHRLRIDFTASVVLLFMTAMVGSIWHHVQWKLFPAQELGLAAKEIATPVAVRLTAWENPQLSYAPPDDPTRIMPSGDSSRLAVWVTHVRDGAEWRPAVGWAELAVDGHLLGVRAGDTLEVMAYLRRHPTSQNPQEYDYAEHYRSDRQLFELSSTSPDAITIVARGVWYDYRRLRGLLRDHCHRLLWRHLDQRQAELAAAVMLGSREYLERGRKDRFFVTGTIHLLAISGLHVGILALGFDWLARCLGLSRRKSICMVTGLVIAYAMLVDARPPVLRATILVVVFCTARFSGRPVNGYNTLAGAGLLIFGWNPCGLLRTGTQLSFLAVATIIFVAPFLFQPGSDDALGRLVASTRPWPYRWLRTAVNNARSYFAVSAAIWLASLPLTAYRFHLVAPIALLLNPLLWLPMVLSLFSGFGVMATGWAFPLLGDLLGWIGNASLWLLEASVTLAQGVECGHWWTAGPAGWWVAWTYAVLAALVAFPAFRPPKRWLMAGFTAWLAAGLWFSPEGIRQATRRDHGALQCLVVSVGHGECVILDLPNGQTLMYDAGCMMSPESGVRSISAALWSRGITHLDAVVLSHADADHYNSLPGLLERFRVGAVYVPPSMFQHEFPGLKCLRQSIDQAGVPIRSVTRGDRFALPASVVIDVLHPPPEAVAGGDNANSVVLLVEHQRRRLLLAGDLDGEGLECLTRQRTKNCDVLLVPHHGSIKSCRPETIAWLWPRVAIVSGGINEDSPGLRAAYAETDSLVLHTAKDGAVQLTLGAECVDVRTWRNSPW